MSLLLTPTLLDAFSWFQNAPSSWKDKARQDLIDKIRRKPWEPNEAVKKGIEFEHKICSSAKLPEAEFEAIVSGVDLHPAVLEEMSVLRNCEFQKVFKQIWNLDGTDNIPVLLYGKADAVHKDGYIIDIKTTANDKGKDKYFAGHQHLFYPVLSGMPHFEYHVFEWLPGTESRIGKFNNYSIDIDITQARIDIIDDAKLFFKWLKAANLWTDYVTIFSKHK